MNYQRYRESMLNIKKLAENYTNLNQSELHELHRLNAQCLTMKEEIVSSFKSVVDELEDGLTQLIDKLEQLKKDADRISGPKGTLEDTLQLEPVWQNTESLLNNIRILLNSGSQNSGNKDGRPAAESLVGPPEPDTAPSKPDINEMVVLSRNEVAATTDKSTSAKLPAPEVTLPKILRNEDQNRQLNNKKPEDQNNSKKAQHKKDQKVPHTGQFNSKPLPVNKSCGDTEKKIIEEISKNMELIKGNKKKL